MRRQLLVNGGLLALALGTLGVVWATRDAATTGQLSARKDKLFTTWNRQQVTRITLQRAGAQLELERAGAGTGVEGDFRIVEPWAERADIATVSALLGSLDMASALRSAPEATPEATGLAAPSLIIGLEIAGKTQTLALGGAAPTPAGARYAKLTQSDGTSGTYVVSQGVASELDLPFDKFRETRLLEYGRSDLLGIEINSPGGKSQLSQRDHGVFFVDTPRGAELCDRERSERLLTALARMATERFLTDEQARSALGADALKVVLRPRAGANVTLWLGGSCPGAPELGVALREQSGQSVKAGCVPAELVDAFRVTSAELAANTPFSARPDEVQELSISVGPTKLDLARKDRAFVLRAPTSADVTLDAGNQRLAALLAAKAERMPEPQLAALGLAPAAGEVTLRISGDAEPRAERVLLGKPRADGSLCLQRKTDDVVLCVDAESARAFQPDATLLKPLELLSVAPSQLAAFSLDSPQLHQRISRSADGAYTLEQPAGFRHDGAAVADAVQALGSLRAERWVAADDDGRRGLGAPLLRAKLELVAPGAASRELTVGASTRDGYFAKLSPDPGVFVLARSALDGLLTPLIDRSLCPVEASALQRVELTTGERHLTLRRQGEGWAAEELRPERAQELAEAASALRAEQALHLGAPRSDEGFAKPSLTLAFVDGAGKRYRVLVGARTSIDGAALAFARLDSVDATYALSAAALRALQDF